MKSLEELLKDEEFGNWFAGRPPEIQGLIRLFPPNKQYRVHDGSFPATVHSYDEEENGSVSMQFVIHSPFFPRTVFGVKPEVVKDWNERRDR